MSLRHKACFTPTLCFCAHMQLTMNLHVLLCRCARLISVKGMTNSSFLGSIQFTWGVAPGAQGPLVSELAQWRFFPSDANDGLTPAFRAVNGQPECFSLDGKSCFTDLDGFSLRMCAASTKSRVRCTPADGARDPIHWCTRARGALGECSAVASAVGAATASIWCT